MYRSGRNENDSKSFCLEIGTRVRIPPSPPDGANLSTAAKHIFFFAGYLLAKLRANEEAPRNNEFLGASCSLRSPSPISYALFFLSRSFSIIGFADLSSVCTREALSRTLLHAEACVLLRNRPYSCKIPFSYRPRPDAQRERRYQGSIKSFRQSERDGNLARAVIIGFILFQAPCRSAKIKQCP